MTRLLRFVMLGWVVCGGSVVSGSAEALHDAVKQGDLSVVRLLLDNGADVNAIEPDGATALHWAAYRDNLPMAVALV